MDQSRAGVIVKAIHQIKGYGPLVPAGEEGHIVYEQDNGLGRMLAFVKWASIGEMSPVFIEEIEVVDRMAPCGSQS